MKIELKNIKQAKFLSEETPAYSASLYVDGKKIGDVSNNGHGGCDSFYGDRKAFASAEAWLMEEHNKDLEVLCHELLDRHECRQQLRKMLNKCVVVFDMSKKSISTFSWKGVKVVTSKHIDHIREKHPSLVILNDFTDREEALDLFMEHT